MQPKNSHHCVACEYLYYCTFNQWAQFNKPQRQPESLSTPSVFEHTNVEVEKKKSMIELFSLAEIWQQERAALP